jgi:hypothetical protein
MLSTQRIAEIGKRLGGPDSAAPGWKRFLNGRLCDPRINLPVTQLILSVSGQFPCCLRARPLTLWIWIYYFFETVYDWNIPAEIAQVTLLVSLR